MQQEIVAIELCISKHGISITKPKKLGFDFGTGHRYSLAGLEYAAMKAHRQVGEIVYIIQLK